MGSNNKDYGEPLRFDPEFNGPTKNRSCTDILFLILFILFMGGWGYLGYFSIHRGDVESLLAPTDSMGYKCGLDSNVVNKPYLVFFDITQCLSPSVPITGCPTKQVCVESCPTETIAFGLTSSDLQYIVPRMICDYDVDTSSITTLQQANDLISSGRCASYVLKSESVLGRCLANLKEEADFLMNLFTSLDIDELITSLQQIIDIGEMSSRIVNDLVQSRWYLLGGVLIVVIICFIYILLLRWIVAPIVWISLAGLLAVLSFSCYLCYNQYDYYVKHPYILQSSTNLAGWLQTNVLYNSNFWLTLLIILAISLVLLTLIVIFLRKRITIAIALIKEGSKAVSDIKTSVAFPMFPWIFQFGVIAYFIVVLCYLISIGKPLFRVIGIDSSCTCGTYELYSLCTASDFSCGTASTACTNATCHYTGTEADTYVKYLHVYNLFGFFWMMFFIQGVSDMMLASTFATWYWTWKKKNLPFFTLTGGIYRTIRYHLGTVALGSMIISIVRVIRVFLEYVDSKLKKYDNPFTRCILCCCKCFFWCLETFLKFINKNAYIMCAVHGKPFCKSARDAFSLLLRNIVRVVVLDKVTDFIFFISKLMISVGVGISVYYIQGWNQIYEWGGEQLHYHFVPAIILGIAAFLITTMFFNVYTMAVDTLFLCFLEDCERNDGTPERPYFMSKNLMKILGKRNVSKVN